MTEYLFPPMTRDRFDLAEAAYGGAYQKNLCTEELLELIQEITTFALCIQHSLRSDRHQPNMVSEIADVYIMLCQMVTTLDISPGELERAIINKLTRLPSSV